MSSVDKLREIAKNFSVLYVEDEKQVRDEVAIYLKKFFKSVNKAENGEEGFKLFKEGDFDIVITDIMMPKMNGIQLAKKIKKINPEQEIVVISAYTETEYFIDFIKIGVSGYIIKPINYKQANEVMYATSLKLHKFKENELYRNNLEQLVEKRTKEKYALQNEKIENYDKSVISLINLIEKRDTYTAGHSNRVAKYCVDIAKVMGYDDVVCKKLYQAGILHDIGKISTPDAILLKPGRLNNFEYRLIQLHVTASYDFLSKIPMYRELAEIIKYHHERFDGKGYPYGLKASKIPQLSRIMIVADAFDAMTTNRIYKKSKTVKEAIREIKELSGMQFDPDVAEAASRALNKVSMQENINQLPKNEIEEERFAYFYKDALTGVYNSNYLEFYIQVKDNNKSAYKYLTGFFLRDFTQYNLRMGWDSGDEMLKKFALYLKKCFGDSLLFRIHGDDFAILSRKTIKLNKEFFDGIGFLMSENIGLETNYIDISAEKEIIYKELINKLRPEKR